MKILQFLIICLLCHGISYANPLLDILLGGSQQPPSDNNTTPLPGNTTTSPFLAEFLRVYEGDWFLVPSGPGEFYSMDIHKEPAVCNENATECCGKITTIVNGTELSWLFCLTSTYQINIKETADGPVILKCIGVRGARINSSLHETLPGWTIDDPTIIHCGAFSLVRPE